MNRIICGDNVDVMRSMDANSIDLTVTSPPYDNLRDYHGYSVDAGEIARELLRVSKDGAVVVWVVADQTVKGSETGTSFRHALAFIDAGWRLHDTMIFRKRNPMPMGGASHRRYQQSWEYMFVFSKGQPKTFNGLMDKCKTAGTFAFGSRSHRNADGSLCVMKGSRKPVRATKIRSNIWDYLVGSRANRDEFAKLHPATFPERLVEDHVHTWTNEGDVVLDIFGGSGTTAKVARRMGRGFIHIDISEEYCELARARIAAAAVQRGAE